MLRLGPPYFDIEGVTVMGDAHDDRQFYYVPNRPHIPVDDQGRPAIRFIVLKDAHDAIIGDTADDSTLKPGEDGGDISGFLFFDTVLSWPERTLDKVRREIEKQLEEEHKAATGETIEVKIRLGPLPYRQGGVQMTLLDETTREVTLEPPPGDDQGDDTQPAQPQTETISAWVPFSHSTGKPSLYGENRAVFQARLSRKAVKLLYGAFSGLIPASVFYELEFVGQMRAYHVRVTADWEQVYTFLQDHFGGNFIFFQVDIDKITTELIESKVINIEAEVDTTDGTIPPEQQNAEFNEVRKDLQDMVLETFFEAAANPHEVDPSTQSGFDSGVDSLVRAQQLLHGIPHVGYSRRDLSITERRSISVDYSVARAVRRRIAPQAHMHVFFEDLSVTRDDLVTVVDGNDSVWRAIDFQVTVNGDFAGAGIDKVVVDVQYNRTLELEPDLDADPDAQWSFIFDSGDKKFERSQWFDDSIGTNFFYRYRVFFRGDAIPGPSSAIASEWRRIDSNVIVADTTELFERQNVLIQAVSTFPWDRYPQVFVRLRYVDPVSNWKHEASKLISAAEPVFADAFRQRAKDGIEPEYQLRFLRNDGEVIETAWQQVVGETSIIPSPDPKQMEVRVIVSPATQIGDNGFVIVDFRYEDAENQVFESASLIFDATNFRLPQTWKVPWKDPTKRRYQMSQMIIDSVGNVTQTGFVETEGSTQVVGTIFAKKMVIQPTLIGPDLASQGIERILLKLKYEDAANGVLNEKLHEFTAPGDVPSWTVMLKDASLRDYSFELTYVLTTGFTKTTGPRTSRESFPVFSTALPQ